MDERYLPFYGGLYGGSLQPYLYSQYNSFGGCCPFSGYGGGFGGGYGGYGGFGGFDGNVGYGGYGLGGFGGYPYGGGFFY